MNSEKLFLSIIGLAGYDPRKGRPRLTAWMERVAKDTAPHYEEAHKFLNLMVEQAEKSKI